MKQMPSLVIMEASPLSDVFGLVWDVIAFLWRHFFDIFELLFTLAFIALVVAIIVGVTRFLAGAPSATDDDRAREHGRPGGAGGGQGRASSPRRPSPSSSARPRTAPRTTAPDRPATTPSRPHRPVQKCAAENNKTVFSTAAKADAKVEQSKKRYALHGGQLPLDHSYRCPHGDHWHVSSKQAY
jgi:hypothetical protein